MPQPISRVGWFEAGGMNTLGERTGSLSCVHWKPAICRPWQMSWGAVLVMELWLHSTDTVSSQLKQKKKGVPGRIWGSSKKQGMAEEPASGRARTESSLRIHKEKTKKNVSGHHNGFQSFPDCICSSPESNSLEREWQTGPARITCPPWLGWGQEAILIR